MKKKIKFFNIRNLLIFSGIIICYLSSIDTLKKYDRYEINNEGVLTHQIIKSDIQAAWNTAEEFRFKIENGENFFSSLPSYERYFLPAVIVGSYYVLIDKEIFDKDSNENKILLKNYKFGILIIQIFLYYFILLFISNLLEKKFGVKYSTLVILFLSIEPTIIQWHSSFWSESFFLSLMLLSIYFLLKIRLNSIFSPLLLGFTLALLFLQKTIAFLYIFSFFIFLILKFKSKLKPVILLTFSFILFMSLIITNNYFKTGNLFLISSQHQYFSYYYYFSHKIISDKKNISEEEARALLIEKENQWKSKNNINLDLEKDYFKNIEYRNKEFLKHFFSNPFFTIKLFIKKTITMSILSPTWVKDWYDIDPSSIEAKNNPKEYYNKNLNRNIYYSILFYVLVIISVLRFAKILKKNNYHFNELTNFLSFNFLSIIYIILIAGFWGNPKYFVPCIVNLTFIIAAGFQDKKIVYFR